MRSGWIGAAAVTRMCAWSRPSSWRTFAPTARVEQLVGQPLPHGGAVDGAVLAHDALTQAEVAGRSTSFLRPCSSPSLARTASWNFSHTRGTAKKTVGWQSRRSSATVARLRANHVSPPTAMGAKSLIMRSAMWLSGRNDRNRSPSADLDHRHGAADRPHDVGVGDHRALGRPGRAARVDEGGDLVGRHRAGPGLEQVGFALEPGRARSRATRSKPTMYGSSMRRSSSKTTMRSSFGSLSLTAEDPPEQVFVLDEAHSRVGVAEDVGHLLGCAGLVERHGHAAVGQRAEVGDVPLESVVGEDPDVLARPRSRARPARP